MILTKELWIPENHPDLEGHFDGFHLLPGVTQIEMVKMNLRDMLLRPVLITEIRKAKFFKMLRPPGSFQLEISLKEDIFEAGWVLKNDQHVYSKGVVSYEYH